eukprot:FR742232.1.p1 GENE.FR742232.1~~FR742232.1.p1  ORF type:complete len:243 (+),score=23.60 FR742232.1:47-730(+)
MIGFLKARDRLREEGIFRVQGSEERRAELQAAVNAGIPILWGSEPDAAIPGSKRPLALQETDTRIVAQMLKAVIRDAPQPLLIPCTAYDAVVTAASTHTEARTELVTALSGVVKTFPPTNFAASGLLFRFLRHVSSFEAQNKMSAQSLAVVFAPTVLRPADASDPMAEMMNMKHCIVAVETMINACDDLFGKEERGLVMNGDSAEGGGQERVKARDTKGAGEKVETL